MTLLQKPAGSKLHACYHWWSHPNEPITYANLRTPIIASIATLRAVSDIPIVVFDMSSRENDWGHFQDKLNFQVIRAKFRLSKYKNLVDGWQYLSRIYDLSHYVEANGLPCDTIMYVDSDVFWLRDPEPLNASAERFVFDGWNTGFFYYDLYSRSNEIWYDIFDSYTRAAIYSDDIRATMKKYLGYDGWYGVWDEMILTYMNHEHSSLFNLTDVNEHCTARVITYADKDKMKMFHCNGTLVANPSNNDQHARGIMALLADEFYQNLTKTLDASDMEMIFGKALIDHADKHRFSLLNDFHKLLATKDEQGLYHTNRMS